MTYQDQVILLYAVINGLMDDIEVRRIAAFKEGLLKYLALNRPEIGQTIVRERALSDDTIAKLREAINQFKQTGAF